MIAATETLRASVRLLRAHPVISLSLGGAIVLSLCSVCTGLGALIAPWFVCELYGVQLATVTRVSRPRSMSWVAAAAVILATVLVVAFAGWLAALGFGPDLATADAAEAPLAWPETVRRIGLIMGSMTLAVGFIAPFVYAPLILIDRGGRIGGAVVESAWLVAHGGVGRHLAISSIVVMLQLSPAVLASMFVARTFERAATPLGLALALPLLPLSIPLGQGILTATYVACRDELASPRVALSRGRTPRTLAILLSLVIIAPVLGLTMLGLSALRPSTPLDGPGRAGEIVVDRAVDAGGAIRVPNTTLVVSTRGPEVSVTAGDGDGVGTLPRRWREDVERVRVVRARGVYSIEIHAGDGTFHARVDGAGERVDDSIRRRLEEHVPTWALLTLLVAFAVCGALLVRALAPLGSLRAAANTGESRSAATSAARRRALFWGLVLAPFSLAALVSGLVSIGWL